MEIYPSDIRVEYHTWSSKESEELETMLRNLPCTVRLNPISTKPEELTEEARPRLTARINQVKKSSREVLIRPVRCSIERIMFAGVVIVDSSSSDLEVVRYKDMKYNISRR